MTYTSIDLRHVVTAHNALTTDNSSISTLPSSNRPSHSLTSGVVLYSPGNRSIGFYGAPFPRMSLNLTNPTIPIILERQCVDVVDGQVLDLCKNWNIANKWCTENCTKWNEFKSTCRKIMKNVGFSQKTEESSKTYRVTILLSSKLWSILRVQRKSPDQIWIRTSASRCKPLKACLVDHRSQWKTPESADEMTIPWQKWQKVGENPSFQSFKIRLSH